MILTGSSWDIEINVVGLRIASSKSFRAFAFCADFSSFLGSLKGICF